MPQQDRIRRMTAEREYRPPSWGEKLFNQIFGYAAGLGIGPSFIYLLEVKGRKSGKVYSTAVNIVEFKGKQYLVAPRGRTQWVRNAETSGEVSLKRGASRKFRLRALTESEKPEILKLYLTSYKGAVQRFFPVSPDANLDAFAQIAAGYPAFELIPA
jgi:deazaflavin-dependent oxidoreductase (nitroreductase family)